MVPMLRPHYPKFSKVDAKHTKINYKADLTLKGLSEDLLLYF